MDNIEKITTLFTKLKQQLLFLKEREKLFKVDNDNLFSSIDSSITTTNSSVSSSPLESIFNLTTNDDMYNEILEEPIKQQKNLLFPDEYIIPQLPKTILEDIETSALHKFAPHHTNRQVLIDIITHDLINKYNLFYPNHKQFEQIGTAIVRKLKLPLTKDNIGVWKDAVQTKLKRTRSANRDHVEVQQYQSKYSKFGSGRPVKRMDGELAQRDLQKQIILVNYDDDTLNNIQMKTKKLRDDTQIDVNTRIQLWKETVHVRRKAIRDQPTSEILEQFPGYRDPVLIFEEVKQTMDIDLRSVVRRQIPILLEKMISTPIFITDSPPIQLIRVLCRQFEETVHHIFCDTKPTTPYPTLVFKDDVIYVYLDFLPIVSTTSPDDGLALLLALYTIFELNFNKNSRAIRLLYAVAFGDKRFISNTIRNFIQKKGIDIYAEKNRKTLNNTDLISNNLTTISDDFQSSSLDKHNSTCPSTIEDVSCVDSNNSNIATTIISEEFNDKIEETSSHIDSGKQKPNRRKRQQKLLTKVVIEKKKSMEIDDNSQDDYRDNINSLVDVDLHPVSRQLAKRKRRY